MGGGRNPGSSFLLRYNLPMEECRIIDDTARADDSMIRPRLPRTT